MQNKKIDNDTLYRLKFAAESASAGPWQIPCREDRVTDKYGETICFCEGSHYQANADYISKACPDMILSLISELEEHRKTESSEIHKLLEEINYETNLTKRLVIILAEKMYGITVTEHY